MEVNPGDVREQLRAMMSADKDGAGRAALAHWEQLLEAGSAPSLRPAAAQCWSSCGV